MPVAASVIDSGGFVGLLVISIVVAVLGVATMLVLQAPRASEVCNGKSLVNVLPTQQILQGHASALDQHICIMLKVNMLSSFAQAGRSSIIQGDNICFLEVVLVWQLGQTL